MAATKYSYSILNDFPNGKEDSGRFAREIQASAIVTALDRIDTAGDVCDVWFKDALSGGDVTILNGLVAAHSGEPLPQPGFLPDGTPIVAATQPDTRIIRRFGNLTSTSTNEVLVSARPYVELASQRQCSVQSTSTQDKAGGTGSVAVRIVYLDSNYVLKSVDLALNGTTKVNSVVTDIRFIEDFFVIQGPVAVGAIQLMDGTTGGATEFCGIGVGTTSAFLCQHYVPAGKTATILGWHATVDDEVKFKVYDQLRYGANLVDNIADLCNAMGITTPPGLISCDHTLQAVVAPEKSRIRLTAVPNQATSTTIRASLYILEISL